MILKIRKLLGLDKVYKATKHTEEEIKQTIESVYPKGFSEVVRKIKPTLVGMLKNNYPLRDNDILLLFTFWELEHGGTFSSYEEFKSLLMQNKLAIPDTITRTRRGLQSKNKELRGDLYEVRMKADKLVNRQIKLAFD